MIIVPAIAAALASVGVAVLILGVLLLLGQAWHPDESERR